MVAAAPDPATFLATSENVYAVPLFSPLKLRGLTADVAVSPPGLAVAM